MTVKVSAATVVHVIPGRTRFFLVALLFFCTLQVGSAQVQQQPQPVVLDGRTLFEVNWGPGTFTTEKRARAISERLKRLAEDPAADINITPHEGARTIDLTAGDLTVLSLFPEDAKTAGMTEKALAEKWAGIIRSALLQYREENRRRFFAVGALVTILTLSACVVAIIGVFRMARSASRKLAYRLHGQIHKARGPQAMVRRDQIERVTWRVFRMIRLGVACAIVYVAFDLVLSYFPHTRFVSREMLHGVMAPLRSLATAIWKSIPSIVFIALIGWFTIQLIKLTRAVFQKIGAGELRIEGFRSAWANTTQQVVSALVIVLGLLIAYPYIPGSDSAAFKGVSLFFGLLISLGSTGLISNLMTGILLTYTDAFQVGDMVRVGEATGIVDRTSLLVTRIRNAHNQVITIPNQVVLTNQVMNYSLPNEGNVVLSALVAVGYDVSWRRVDGALRLAASRTQGVCRTPEPRVLKASLDQFSTKYELGVHVEPGFSPFAVQSELNGNVLDVCNEYGIQIMTPEYENDRATPAIVPKERWHLPPAA